MRFSTSIFKAANYFGAAIISLPISQTTLPGVTDHVLWPEAELSYELVQIGEFRDVTNVIAFVSVIVPVQV